ncbi:hypothetical protein [Streptomyces sp. S3(2020)]|nr:hypothetical protein [Streptomyces sp. S3(2020)]
MAELVRMTFADERGMVTAKTAGEATLAAPTPGRPGTGAGHAVG